MERRSKTASALDRRARPHAASRQARRRESTQSKLLDATRALTLERDLASITIAEIAARADVGFGSFYNHFASKEEILEAAIAREVEWTKLAVDSVLTVQDDCALRLSSAIRYFTRSALRDPMWRWFVGHVHYASVAIQRVMGTSIERDLEMGRRSGRFRFDNVSAAAEFIVGGTVTVLASAIHGRIREEHAERLALLVLRALGVDEDELAALVRQRLPALPNRKQALPRRS